MRVKPAGMLLPAVNGLKAGRALLAVVAVAALAVPAQAATLLAPVTGYTIDSFGRLAHFSSLAIGEDGTVQSSAAAGDGLTAPVAGARLVLPGFIRLGVEAADVLGATDAQAVAALDSLTAQGWTSIQLCGVSLASWQILARLPDRQGRARIVAVLDGDGDIESPLLRAGPVAVDDRLTLRAVRYRVDRDGEAAGLRYSDARLKNLIVRAHLWRWQVVLRTESTEAIDQAVNAFAETLPTLGVALRPLLVTTQAPTPVQAQRLAALGVGLAVPPEALAGVQPLAEAGARIAVMTDTPTALLAVPPQSDVVRALTEAPARLLRLDSSSGALLPGRAADLVVLGPASAPADVWISGRRLSPPAPPAAP